jgi:hypothetical protein
MCLRIRDFSPRVTDPAHHLAQAHGKLHNGANSLGFRASQSVAVRQQQFRIPQNAGQGIVDFVTEDFAQIRTKTVRNRALSHVPAESRKSPINLLLAEQKKFSLPRGAFSLCGSRRRTPSVCGTTWSFQCRASGRQRACRRPRCPTPAGWRGAQVRPAAQIRHSAACAPIFRD